MMVVVVVCVILRTLGMKKRVEFSFALLFFILNDTGCTTPSSVFWLGLGFELRASHLLSKRSLN
jgi:hypothetical protein